MHAENLAPLLSLWPLLPVLSLALLGWFFWHKASHGRRYSSEEDAQRQYWLKEKAWRLRMHLRQRFLPGRDRRLTYQPSQMEGDASIAAIDDEAYPGGMADEFRTRLARAKFRAWHRGTREADFTIGGFYDRYHLDWGEAELTWFERLLEEDDVSILAWAMGSAEPPQEFQGEQLAALKKLDFVSI